jgi:alginate O-acetyltransferase complex protein AlgJ
VTRAIILALALLGTTLQPGARAADATVDAFRNRCAALAAAADKADTMTVAGADGWFFISKELRHLSVGKFWGPEAAKVSRADKPQYADPLPAILDFKAQLDKAGIELLLVPVPPKAIIYPDKLPDSPPFAAAPPRLDTAHQEFYDVLRKQGVKVLDQTPDFIAHRADKEGNIFCKQDTHWSGLACVRTAQQIAKEIKGREWLKQTPKLSLASDTKAVEIDGDLRQALKGEKPARETLPLRFVGTKGGADLAPVEPDPRSPVILLGSSHVLVFHAGGDMLATGAGLADQLALELGVAVDLIGVRGSGATPARVNLLRRARAQADYLARKKLVIWCLDAREFTESTGWQKVPVVK